jgi:hypothetical protein
VKNKGFAFLNNAPVLLGLLENLSKVSLILPPLPAQSVAVALKFANGAVAGSDAADTVAPCSAAIALRSW